jgi:hypothetical protein
VHISAFVPTHSVAMENGQVNATGVPVTFAAFSGQLPMQMQIPILLCVWSEAGSDPNPCIYVQARDPQGRTRGNAEMIWLWDDVPGQPYKWRVFDLTLSFVMEENGVYTFGVYQHPEDAETDHYFALPISISG